jgi:glycosyltransferase involved in cell wall biosynthesis
MRILYCTWVPLAGENGGNLVCREHLQRLAAIDDCDLHVCTIGDPAVISATRSYIDGLGAQFHPIDWAGTIELPDSRRLLGRRWPFTLETDALARQRTDQLFARLADEIQPTIVIVDYLFTALFIPSIYSGNARVITITLNQETSFFGQLRRLGGLDSQTSNSFIAQLRLSLFERAVCSRSDILVSLSSEDLRRLPGGRVLSTHIEPAIDDAADRWCFHDNGGLFFVGNIAHYPNRLAIAWLAEKFAPASKSADPDLRIRIIGATEADIPSHWKQSNIDYLGLSTQQQVETELKTCKCFIAPIENNFGAKMKILQCLSHGTPLIATREALSGVPFARRLPQFSLADPEGAAGLASELARSPQRLNCLSAELGSRNRDFAASRKKKWAEILTALRTKPLRPRSRVRFWSPLWRPRPVDTAQPWPAKIEIGVRRPLGVSSSGLHPLETTRGGPLVWTAPKAEIRVRLNQKTLPKRITVDLYGFTPAGGVNVIISTNGIELYRGSVHKTGMRKRLKLPNLEGRDELMISFDTPGFQFSDDTPWLGVAIRSLLLAR